MNRDAILAILRREIREQVLSRRFLFMTLSLPLFMGGVIALQAFLMNWQDEDRLQLVVFTETEQTGDLLRDHFMQGELGTSRYAFDFLTGDADGVATYIERRREALRGGDLTGVLFVPESARRDKQLHYYSANPGNQNLLGRLRAEVNAVLLSTYMGARGLDQDAIDYVRRNVSINGVRVTETGTSERFPADMVVAFVFTLLLYMSLLMIGPMMMGAVNEEKTNRVVEIVLSSVSARDLMAGKILGTALAGLLQMIVWLLPLLLLALGGLPVLVALVDIDIRVDWGVLAYFLFNYLLGLLTFLSLFSAIGAIFDTPQDAQSAMFPVMLLIIVPFLLALSMASNPASTLVEVGSMLPFFSIMVMPARMILIDVPAWQSGLAVLVNLATLYLAVLLSGKIYRTAILMTGKRPSWAELYKWLRYST